MIEKKQQSLAERIANLDLRIIYLILILSTIIPLISPLGLPLLVNKETKDLYDYIENIPDGTKVLCSFDIEAGLFPEIGNAGIVMGKHLFKKDVKMVFVFFYRADGPLVFTEMVLPKITGYEDVTHIGDKVYGVDWVILGYIEGHETAMAQLASNFHLVSLDHFGNRIDDLPLMSEIHTANDFDLYLDVGGGDIVEGLTQFSVNYDVPAGHSGGSSTYPNILPFYQSGALVGMLNGMRGTAEYEFLAREPGQAIVAMDSFSLSHVLLIIIIIIGNITYIYTEKVYDRRGK